VRPIIWLAVAAHVLIPLLLSSWWEFPAEPISAEVSRGAGFFKKNKGIERTLLEDRFSLGTWYDGKVKRDVEQAIRLSPSMLSRWLGYLEAREKWGPEAIARRWQQLRGGLEGRLAFVVQISSMPKADLFEPHLRVESFSNDWLDVRFLVTLGGRGLPRAPTREPFFGWSIFRPKQLESRSEAPALRLEPEVSLIALLQGRDRSRVLGHPWYVGLPFERELSPEFGARGFEYVPPVGEYKSAWFLVTVPLPDNAGAYADLQLWVFSKGKERIADWDLSFVAAELSRAPG
jgi:hypothetical protein